MSSHQLTACAWLFLFMIMCYININYFCSFPNNTGINMFLSSKIRSMTNHGPQKNPSTYIFISKLRLLIVGDVMTLHCERATLHGRHYRTRVVFTLKSNNYQSNPNVTLYRCHPENQHTVELTNEPRSLTLGSRRTGTPCANKLPLPHIITRRNNSDINNSADQF